MFMKRNKLIIIILCLLNSVMCFGQNIRGKVSTSKGEPISFANVVAITQIDSTFVTGAITNDEGLFFLSANKDSVLLRVSSIGYEDVCVSIHSLPVIVTLQEAVVNIGEVVIKGHKPAYKITKEGILTNVAGTSLNHLGSGDDVLAHIPGIYKGGDGFQVFGKGTPVIYLNGRKIYDLSVIQNLKSEDIKTVEAITTPGAKYGAEVRSVIRIQTKNPVGEGLGMNYRSSYYQSENADFINQMNWNYRHSGLDLFGSHSYKELASRSESNLTQDVVSDTLWHQANHQLAFNKSLSYRNSIGFNYQLNEKSSLGMKYTLKLQPDEKGRNSMESDVTANGMAYDRLLSESNSKTVFSPYHQLNAYYSGQISKATLNFDVDYLYNRSNTTSYFDELSQENESRILNTFSRSRSELFASKLSLDFKAFAADMVVGTEYTSTHRNNSYDNPEQYVESTDCKVSEEHFSPFAELSWNLPIGLLQAGLRYEYVWFDYDENGHHVDGQSKRFSNFFPNLSLARQIENTQLLLSYVAKTRRPSYSQLDNSVYYGTRFTYQGGNPLLKAETIHDLSLSAVWGFAQAILSYNDRRNAIIYSADMYKDNSSVSLITYNNIKSLKSFSFMGALSPQIGIWNPELQMGVIKQWLSLDTKEGRISMNKPVVMVSLSNTLEFGYGWRGLLDMSYTSKGYSENCYLSRSVSSVDASLYKSFLKDCLTVRLGVSDLFKSKKSGHILHFYQMTTTQSEWQDSREVFLTVRYKFNVTKSKYKGSGAGRNEKNRL